MRNLLRLFLSICYLLGPALGAEAQEAKLDTTMWETNGPVYAFARKNNTVYIGGEFTYIGPNTGTGAAIGLASGDAFFDQYPVIEGGVVETAIPDGKGGWFIGGTFTRVQGVKRERLAHLLADNSLDTRWQADADSTVKTLLLHEGKLFVGGKFNTINGANRLRLAALDAATGQATFWNPVVRGLPYDKPVHYQVMALGVLNGNLYVGGNFTSINDEPRNHLAAVEIATGKVTAWNPNKDNPESFYTLDISYIKNISISGTTVYVSGWFAYLGSAVHASVAAIDAETGAVASWSPPFSGLTTSSVTDMALVHDTLYLAGRFYLEEMNRTRNLIAIHTADGRILPWFPEVFLSNDPEPVKTIAVAGRTIYVGGYFNGAGGQPRRNLAAFDIHSGQATDWSPNVNIGPFSRIYELTASGGTLYVGGEFASIGGQKRRHLAAVDANTGRPTDWNPGQCDGYVFTLLVHKDLLYVGGGFSDIGGLPRNRLAAIDAATGKVTPFDAKIIHSVEIPTQFGVKSLLVHDEKLYIGGNFGSVGGQTRWNLASIDLPTGRVTDWHPNVQEENFGRASVNSMAVADGKLYLGGSFTKVGGARRIGLSSVDLLTGQVTPFDPHQNYRSFSFEANAIIARDSLLYIGGSFGELGSVPRKSLAAVKIPSGELTAFNPSVDGTVRAMQLRNNELYMVGGFRTVNGESRTIAAAVDVTTSSLTSWHPDYQSRYYPGGIGLAFIDNRLWVGGTLYTAQGRPRNGLAVYGKKPHSPNYIKGRIYHDENANCVKDNQEESLESMIVVATPGPYYGISDEAGNYSIAVDTGAYVVSQVLPAGQRELVRQVCPADAASHNVIFNSYNNTVQGKDFGNQVASCARPYVNVTSTRRRRCMSSSTVVAYCNSGNAAATGAKVFVKLPGYVVLVRADKPFTVDKDSNYVFDVGTLLPGGCGVISLTDSVVCNNPDIRGLTQCTKAWMTPGNNCTAPSANWDKSDITLKARCLTNGVVRLALYNTGTGPMADSAAYRVLLDARLALGRNFKLAAGDSLILRVPANGRTVRLEADQRPGHPTKQSTNVTLEACGTNAGGGVSLGFVAQLPCDDAEPEVAEECLPITDSYDPNDKLVRPAGTTDQHYTPTGAALNYTVRFQNMGNDYAYTVVVVDTLAAGLDLSTLQMGAVSHPYKFTVSGKGRPVLTWTFNNINLPDSARDQAGSNGFIQFSIKPVADLPAKALIENYADIFFDYNPPVRTNTTANRIYDVPYVVEPSARLDENAVIATPVITSFSPASGTAGTVVTLTGKHFDAVPGNNAVTFNGIAAPVTGATATTLTVTVPPGEAAGRIRVGTPDGVALSATDFLLASPPPTGLAPGLPAGGVRIYPNPAPGRFVVEFSQSVRGITEVVILDARGGRVQVLPLAGKRAGRVEIDLTGHPAGMYLVLVRTEHGTTARKVALRP